MPMTKHNREQALKTLDDISAARKITKEFLIDALHKMNPKHPKINPGKYTEEELELMARMAVNEETIH